MGEAFVAFAGGALKGAGIAQQQAAERALQKATLDLQQKKLKLEEQESGLKMQLLQQQIAQQGGIQGLLQQFLGGGQQGGAAPGIESPAMGQPVPPQPQQGGMGGPGGGLELEGISIGKEGPTLRIGRPERARSEADRLALSMFGKPFTQLDQSQQGAVLKTEQERKVEISAATGAAGVTAKGQAELDLPLGPEDVGKLILPGGRKLPFGITGRQAIEAGAVPISAAEQAKQLALGSMDSILGRLDSQVDKLFTEEGVTGRFAAAGKNTAALLRQDTDAVLYEALKEATLANLTRSFGQTGTLTDRDVEIVRNLLPSFAPRVGQPLPDTKTAAREKMLQVREVIKEIAQRAGGTGGAAPASAPNQAGPKATSGPAKKGRLKFNPQTGAIE